MTSHINLEDDTDRVPGYCVYGRHLLFKIFRSSHAVQFVIVPCTSLSYAYEQLRGDVDFTVAV